MALRFCTGASSLCLPSVHQFHCKLTRLAWYSCTFGKGIAKSKYFLTVLRLFLCESKRFVQCDSFAIPFLPAAALAGPAIANNCRPMY